MLKPRITQRYDADIGRAHSARLKATRFAILMVAAETPSYVATATLLSIPIGTVRSRLFRARMALAKLRDAEAAKELSPHE